MISRALQFSTPLLLKGGLIMFANLNSLYYNKRDIESDISKMKSKVVYRTEEAIRNGRLPSVDIRHYCRDYGVTYKQCRADECLWDAISAASRKLRQVREKIWETELDLEYYSMC